MGNESTEIRILDTALEMFWRRSYHSVNMNALSLAAGLNKATVYQYFASKEALAIAAITYAAQKTEKHVYQAAFGVSADAQTRLRLIYDKAYAMHASFHQSEGKCRGCPFVNLGVELATESEGVRRAVNSAFAALRPYYEDIVTAYLERARGIHPGARRAAQVEDIVAGLLANMNGCLVASKLENRPEAVLDGKRRALQLIDF